MRRALAWRLVGVVSWCWHHSYCCHEGWEAPGWFWHRAARGANRWLLPVAMAVHHERAVDRMCNEGWWG